MEKRIINWIKNHSNFIFWFLVIFLFFSMVLLFQELNYQTDDFVYSNCWNSDRPLSSIQDIIHFQTMHYLLWGGRIVAHSILQILFLIGNPWNSILNTLCYFALAYIISTSLKNTFNRSYFILSLVLFYYLVADKESVIFWFTGYANYVWTALLLFLAAKPFILHLKDTNNALNQYYLLPIYLLAGCTNENMATSFILFLIYVMYTDYKKTKKVPLFSIIATFFTCIGCAFMLLAPGNGVRATQMGGSILSTIVYRIHSQLFSWSEWLFIPMILLIILMYCNNRLKHKRNKSFTYPLLGWYVLSVIVFIMSPSYPQRASTGSLIILIILILDEIKLLLGDNQENRTFFNFLCLLLLLCLAIVMFSYAMKFLSFRI